MTSNPIRLCCTTLVQIGLLSTALTAAPAFAHGDEDHSKDGKPPAATMSAPSVSPGAAAREAPTRLADGSLFVPKAVQRQLALRTARVATEALSTTVELHGRVIADAGAGGRIQATQAGTVLAGPRGFPAPGTRVRQGDVLAQLRPTISSLERSGQQAEQADLAAQLTLAERRAQRLAQLEGSVPAKEIEAAQVEARGLRERLAARRGGLDVPQALTAPVSGVVSAVHVVAGEVVDAKDVLFEIVDPSRLAVEALAYDPALPARLGNKAAQEGLAGDTRLALRLTGAGLQLREQALPMIFRIESTSAPVAVGQPVKVFARSASNDQGISVPKSAVILNNAGEAMVWVHSEAERFEPRRVTQAALGAERVAIRNGLTAGERVVIDGASLLAQVR